MKYLLSILIFTGIVTKNGWSQKNNSFTLSNALIVSQQEDISDRYSVEIALLQLFKDYGINTKVSLNVVKEGGDLEILLNDSIQKLLKNEGIDTYLLVAVHGYDNRFKPLENVNDFENELKAGHLFPLYRDNSSRVTFSFIFYMDSKPVHYELIRTGSVGSKEAVIKKLLKKVKKRMRKEWLK